MQQAIAIMQKIQRYMETGVRETSTVGVGTSSWEDDYSEFVGLHHPFMTKGGYFSLKSHAGRFFFASQYGDSHFSVGFSPIVVPVN